MELVVVRHAIAEDREQSATRGGEDALRALTADGARKMRKAARGLRQVMPAVDVIASSPFRRAAETAEILRRAYELDAVETADVLKPGRSVADVVAWLARFGKEAVMIVGHEPQLGRLVTLLVSGVDRSAVELKKGAACRVDFDARVKAGRGMLAWALPPGLLRDLAE